MIAPLALVVTAAPAATVAPAAQLGGSTFLVLGLWVLLLAIFTGVELITKVPPTLHTPLMSGANAISGITIVGALYSAGSNYPTMGKVIGFLAIVMATINVVGGFLVTDRMLGMFGGRGGSRGAKGGKS
jgi:NAD(P) transhydrogenase subunit alpha